MKAPLAILLVTSTLAAGLEATPAADTAQILESFRKQYDLPALLAVVVKDGEICDRAAVGVRKMGDQTPATTNDIVHSGSCTKAMTATLAGMFIDEGKLQPFHYDNPPAIAPAGCVHCSLDDLARFTRRHLQGERSGGLLNYDEPGDASRKTEDKCNEVATALIRKWLVN